jgi:uncharacterized protein HemX
MSLDAHQNRSTSLIDLAQGWFVASVTALPCFGASDPRKPESEMKHQKPDQFHEETAFPSAFAAPVAEAFGKGATMFGRSFTTMQKESVRFVNQRLEDNMKAVETFASCKNLPDLFAAQQKWFADMTRAYTAEWQRYGEMMTEMARENTEDVEAEMRKHTRAEHTH